jgi:hypothetical protein
MSEPVRLTVVVPMMGSQAPYRLSDPCGYIVPNLMPATWVTHRPVEDIAHALEVDGYGPAVHFGLLNERSEIMFIGPIGRKQP